MHEKIKHHKFLYRNRINRKTQNDVVVVVSWENPIFNNKFSFFLLDVPNVRLILFLFLLEGMDTEKMLTRQEMMCDS